MFITFEGIEGCGKSTQAKKLYEFFLQQKKEVILTREPGGAEASEKIREILLDETIPALEAKTELLLNFAARVEHVEKLIKPALREGKIVISDRFFDSTYAYQGSAFGLADEIIDGVKNTAIGDFAPDITFLIDVPLELAFSRIEGRVGNNRYEKLGFEFHKKVQEGFLNLAKKNPLIKVIDGTKNIEEISSQIQKFLISK